MKSPRSSAAFSLVEVMVAILILGVGLVGLTEAVTSALRSAKESEVQTMAVLEAAGKIEELRADGFYTEGETDGECTSGLSQYRWRQTVARGEAEGLYEVTVAIEHGSSGKQVYELKTMLFDPPTTGLTSRTNSTSNTRPDRDSRRSGRDGNRRRS